MTRSARRRRCPGKDSIGTGGVQEYLFFCYPIYCTNDDTLDVTKVVYVRCISICAMIRSIMTLTLSPLVERAARGGGAGR